MKHVDKKTANDVATWLVDCIRTKIAGLRIMGPAEPMINKVRNEYLVTILLKIPRNMGKLADIKAGLYAISEQLHEKKEWRQAKLQFDVDPS